MATVIKRADGSTMVIYSRAELHDIIRSQPKRELPPGVRAAERGR